ncbi:hypothetical protein O6H91_17G024600 [Diphasiastrum complanatum]|nr:hypothetical protein O6H91_17G024600 [Diphasiastrum complanatum]
MGPNIQSSYMREVGRRRIFVQVDTGNVLGLELDRDEKVQSVKKKVQAALCVPTEQSSLVFGDHELQNDLRQVRNDSPLLLARGLQRSSSTPCLSPTSEVSKPKDWSRPIELLGGPDNCYTIKKLIRASTKAIEKRMDPVKAGGGLGGAYFFKNSRGENIALVKPTDEEPFAPNNPKGFVGKVLGQPGLKRSIRVGETGVREVAAYLLDHERFAKVPATALVKVTHSVFNVNFDTAMSLRKGDGLPVAKIASFQQFIQHDYDANDHGTSCFPVSSVHRIGILDLRIFNTDRHAGNILVKNRSDGQRLFEKRHLGVNESVELIPIDHGLCLPETLEDPYFEWLHWPQASVPFSEEELRYINKLEPYKDAEMLRGKLPMLREACLRMLILCTTFLKMGASAGLCLADIGTMMSREVCGMDEEASEFETVCMLSKLEVEDVLADASVEGEKTFTDCSSEEQLLVDQFQFHMELGESWDGFSDSQSMLLGFSPSFSSCSGYSSPSTLSPRTSIYTCYDSLSFQHKLQPLEEEITETSAIPIKAVPTASYEQLHSPDKLGAVRSLSYMGGNHQSCSHLKMKKIGNVHGNSVKSASDPTHVLKNTSNANLTFLSDMSENKWRLFVEYFQELLQDAFTNWKSKKASLSQKLGTSCQF